MIDDLLIKNTTKHLETLVLDSVPYDNHFKVLSDCLPRDVISKLHSYIFKSTNLDWQVSEINSEVPRKKITWDSDTIIEELHCAFENITPTINKVFPKKMQHNFIGLSLWEDSEDYVMGWHVDNPILSANLQIYLFDKCPEYCGIKFSIDGNNVSIPYKHNTGYLLDQSLENRYCHRISNPVPPNCKRYSLYVSWSHTEKLPR